MRKGMGDSMSTLIEPSFQQERRRPQGTGQGAATQLLREGEAHRALLEIPEALGTISRQLGGVRKLLLEQAQAATVAAEKTHAEQVHQTDWVERMHDRFDALLVESQVTNVLLAKLVATQLVIIQDDTTVQANALRDAAYRQVLNGE